MRILVVEDDKDILNFLKLSLEAEGFFVETAENGEKGVPMAIKNKYALVILDRYLPDTTGDLICQEIRDRGNIVPILITTVDTSVKSKVELLNLGADDYLTKPFSFEELLARIRALLRRPKNMAGNLLHIDNLILDRNKQTVNLDGKEIYLTRKEFALLEYLMLNQGQVVSKAVILENIWDSETDIFSNTIETHVFNLRKKINKNSSNDMIKTVFGRGYKIN